MTQQSTDVTLEPIKEKKMKYPGYCIGPTKLTLEDDSDEEVFAIYAPDGERFNTLYGTHEQALEMLENLQEAYDLGNYFGQRATLSKPGGEVKVPSDKAICKTIRAEIERMLLQTTQMYHKMCQDNLQEMARYYEGKKDGLKHAWLETDNLIRNADWLVDDDAQLKLLFS